MRCERETVTYVLELNRRILSRFLVTGFESVPTMVSEQVAQVEGSDQATVNVRIHVPDRKAWLKHEFLEQGQYTDDSRWTCEQQQM